MIESVKHVNELEFNKERDHSQKMSPLRLEFARFTKICAPAISRIFQIRFILMTIFVE